jgi:hypothetical protein
MLLAGLQKNAIRPSEGPYYLVKYKNNWAIEAFPSVEYGGVGHQDVWKNYIVPRLIESYGLNLTREQKTELESAYTGFPRGRISASGTDPSIGIELPGEKAGHWYVDHGNDLPSEISREKWMGMVAQSFGLYGLIVRNMVEFRVSPHEKMDPDDVKIIRKLIK